MARMFAVSEKRGSVVADDKRISLRSWPDRIRDPSLTALLILELCLVFLAAPLAARGLEIARPIGETLVLAVLMIVVLLSQRPGAIGAILLGLAATLASLAFRPEWSPVVPPRRQHAHVLGADQCGSALSLCPRITSRRLQGAPVVYLNLATIFASAYSLLWGLNPTAFTNLPTATGGPGELAIMLYFSITTLTTTGYGDIVAVDPFARSLANLESVLGQFYLGITVARLVILELEHRRH